MIGPDGKATFCHHKENIYPRYDDDTLMKSIKNRVNLFLIPKERIFFDMCKVTFEPNVTKINRYFFLYIKKLTLKNRNHLIISAHSWHEFVNTD